MIRSVATLILISTTVQPQVAVQTPNTTVESAKPVVEWNNTLFSLVHTPFGQPGTIHIDGTHSPDRIQILGTPPSASQGAEAAAAANEVLIGLYASSRATFDRPPATAIRAADWLPELGNTASDPSYPDAHAVIPTPRAVLLGLFVGTDQFSLSLTSEVMAGVQRSFTTFSAAAEEAMFSRIFAGAHFRTDLAAGRQLGTNVRGTSRIIL
jgi:hypothetical protein